MFSTSNELIHVQVPLYFAYGETQEKEFYEFEKYIMASIYNIPSFHKQGLHNNLKQFYCDKLNNSSLRRFFYNTINSTDINDFLSQDRSIMIFFGPSQEYDDLAMPYRLMDHFNISTLKPFIEKIPQVLEEHNSSLDSLDLYFFCCRSNTFIHSVNTDIIKKILGFGLLDDIEEIRRCIVNWSARTKQTLKNYAEVSKAKSYIRNIASQIFTGQRLQNYCSYSGYSLSSYLSYLESGKRLLASLQRPDGSWSWSDNVEEMDIITTCMAVHALSFYVKEEGIKRKLHEASAWLKKQWMKNTILGRNPALDILCLDSISLCEENDAFVSYKVTKKNKQIIENNKSEKAKFDRNVSEKSITKNRNSIRETTSDKKRPVSVIYDEVDEKIYDSDELASLIVHDNDNEDKTESIKISKACKERIKEHIQSQKDTDKNLKEFWEEKGQTIIEEFEKQLIPPTGKNLHKQQLGKKLKECKVLILSANTVEGSIISRRLMEMNKTEKLERITDDKQIYQFSQIGDVKIVHIWPLRTSSFTVHGSYNALKSAFEKFIPEYVFSVGVAFGADPKTQSLGDVLIADHLVFYDSFNKVTDGTVYLSPDEVQEIGAEIICGCPALNQKNAPKKNGIGEFKWHKGAMLTGGSVISDSVEKHRLMEAAWNMQYPIIGGEMEGSGVFFGCNKGKEPIPFTIIKGICDWAINKNGWHFAAASNEEQDTIKDCVQAYACNNAFMALSYILTQISYSGISETTQ